MPDRPAVRQRPERALRRPERRLPGWLAAPGRDRLDAALLVAIGLLVVLLGVLGSTLSAGAAARPPAPAPGSLDRLLPPQPPVFKPVVWIIGDEFAAGTGNGSWTARTAKALGLERHLVAASGLGYTHQATVGGTKTTLRIAVRQVDPGTRVVVLAAGRADHAATSIELVGAAAGTIKVAQAQAPEAKIIVVGPAAPESDLALDGERKALASAAKENGATFVDPIGKHWLSYDDVLADGSHLTAAGQKVVAAKMQPVLAAALKG